MAAISFVLQTKIAAGVGLECNVDYLGCYCFKKVAIGEVVKFIVVFIAVLDIAVVCFAFSSKMCLIQYIYHTL